MEDPAPAEPREAGRTEAALRAVAFVARCSGAASVAYLLANRIGLPFAGWAAISALIVSQDRLSQTRSSLLTRILGTVLGITVAVAVSVATSRVLPDTAAQMAVAVAICAAATRWRPAVRVSLWTAPLVLLTARPDIPVALVALHRGGEVILGALIGGAFHWGAERLVSAFFLVPARQPEKKAVAAVAEHIHE